MSTIKMPCRGTRPDAYLYFILLGLSCAAFLVAQTRSFASQVVIGAFLAAHYLILPMVFYHQQLQSVLALRFLPVLSLVACLQALCFSQHPTWTPIGIAALTFQAALLTVVVHLRAVAAWQTDLVIGWCLLALARFAVRTHPSKGGAARTRGRRWSAAGAIALPGGLLLVGLLALDVYRHTAFDSRYRQGEQILTRPIWHNFLSGFAFNPSLASEYQLKIDDLSEMRAVGRYLTQHGRQADWIHMGGASPGFSAIRWSSYDPAARDLFFDIVRRHPVECLRAAFYDKPLALGAELAWLFGFRHEMPYVDIFVSPELGDAMAIHLGWLEKMLNERKLRISLCDPVVLTLVLVFAILGVVRASSPPAELWIPLGLLAAGSLIPSIVGYPALHTLAEAAIMLTVVVLVGAVSVLVSGLQKLSALVLSSPQTPTAMQP